MTMALECLENSSYALRAQGAGAVAAVAKAGNASRKAGHSGVRLVAIPPARLHSTVAAVAKALAGQIWEGKEALLHALAALGAPLVSFGPAT